MRISFNVLFFTLLASVARAGTTWTLTDATSILKAVAADPAPIKVVNVWATWCPPCKAELPEFVKFSTQPGAVPVYYVSGDDASNRKEAEAFLRGLGAKDHLFQLDHVDVTQLKTFAGDWAGALPGTFVYDRSGKLLKFWVGRTTAKVLAERIKGLDHQAPRR